MQIIVINDVIYLNMYGCLLLMYEVKFDTSWVTRIVSFRLKIFSSFKNIERSIPDQVVMHQLQLYLLVIIGLSSVSKIIYRRLEMPLQCSILHFGAGIHYIHCNEVSFFSYYRQYLMNIATSLRNFILLNNYLNKQWLISICI